MITLDVRGLDGLQQQLDELQDVTLAVKALAAAARKAFKPVLETAKALVPVDSGDTREALRLAVKKPRGGEPVVVVGLKILATKTKETVLELSPARRWHWIEFGTAHMAAHPFLRPALDQNAQLVLDLLRVELNKSIARIKKRAAKAAAKAASS